MNSCSLRIRWGGVLPLRREDGRAFNRRPRLTLGGVLCCCNAASRARAKLESESEEVVSSTVTRDASSLFRRD